LTTTNPIPQQLTLGELTHYQGLSMLPVYDEVSREMLDYITLDDAVTRNLIRITEVSESGTVPELRLENLADRPVLLMDGEELVGAKQNRVLNLTILVPAGESIIVPVSCVESGRWAYKSDNFVNSERAHFAAGRSRTMASVSESMCQQGTRHSDQGEVWAEIDSKFARMKSSSSTAAMADLYDTVSTDLEEYVSAFPAEQRQVGAFFFIHGSLVGFDFFDRATTWARLHKKLLRSYAIDAIERPVATNNSVNPDEAPSLLAALRSGDWQTYPAIGMGVDYRFSSPTAASAGLVFNEATIHLSGFILKNSTTADEFEGRMSAARARRQMRRK
jgi:hypothetical protein